MVHQIMMAGRPHIRAARPNRPAWKARRSATWTGSKGMSACAWCLGSRIQSGQPMSPEPFAAGMLAASGEEAPEDSMIGFARGGFHRRLFVRFLRIGLMAAPRVYGGRGFIYWLMAGFHWVAAHSVKVFIAVFVV